MDRKRGLWILFAVVIAAALFASLLAGGGGTEPGAVPVQARTGWSSAVPAVSVYTVPTGYRLVIEFVSAINTVDFQDAMITTTVGGVIVDHYLSVQPQASPGEPGVVSQATMLHADPGSTVRFLGHAGAGGAGITVISGYLVPVSP